MRKNNTNIVYVHCNDKNNAINKIQNSHTCYCIVDDNDYDLFDFFEMIENDDDMCMCDKSTIFYLSNKSIVEKSLEIEVDMIDEFTHFAFENNNDSFNVCTNDVLNFMLNLSQNERDAMNK